MYSEFLIRVVPAIVTSIVICFAAIPVIIKIADLKKLMDESDQFRKIHHNVIPTLGGIGIFAAFLISFSIWGNAASLESYPFFVAGLFMLFLTGIKDDILTMSANSKLLIQTVAAAEIVIGGGVVFTDFQGLFGIYEVSWITGALVTILAFVALINSYNLIDGIDGLAGGIGIVVSSILGIWFWHTGFISLSVLSFALAGSLVGFLIYNVHPAKIFMGDTGSMAVGFILAYLVMQFLISNNSVAGSGWYIENAPVFAISLLIIPIVDTLRVFTLRILAGKSPFVADRNHTHHQLLNAGMSADIASFCLWMANFVLVALAYFLSDINSTMLMFIVLVGGFSVLPICKSLFSIYSNYNRRLVYYSYLKTRDSFSGDGLPLIRKYSELLKHLQNSERSKKDDKEISEVG